MTSSVAQKQKNQQLEQLVGLFAMLFADKEKTVLCTGASEPFYQAWEGERSAVIYSREDYFSSALHEIAHWCIAGEERRKIDDFGYWYKPEGRDQKEQIEFEIVEVKPQAIEWAFSLACNHPFHFSADNLSQELDASESFKENVTQQLDGYLKNGLPTRAQQLFDAMIAHFRNGEAVNIHV